MHPVDRFRQALEQLDRYPRGVVKVPQLIDGTAFFAAGPGLYCDQPPSIAGLPPFPVGKTVFVGNHLDAEGPYRARLASGVAHGDRFQPMRTWHGLYQLLDAAGLDPHDCFFTNAYVGLIEGDKPTGGFPGASDTDFSAWCEDFLRLQIATIKPAVLATIGAEARRFVARLTPDLPEWIHGSSQAVHDIEIDGHSLAAVALAHPSMYPASAHNRRFNDEQGVAAEAALLLAAGEAGARVDDVRDLDRRVQQSSDRGSLRPGEMTRQTGVAPDQATLTREAERILEVFRVSHVRSGASVHSTEFGDAIFSEDGRIRDVTVQSALAQLIERGYLIDYLVAFELTDLGDRHLYGDDQTA